MVMKCLAQCLAYREYSVVLVFPCYLSPELLLFPLKFESSSSEVCMHPTLKWKGVLVCRWHAVEMSKKVPSY